jgi:hypothetical protein
LCQDKPHNQRLHASAAAANHDESSCPAETNPEFETHLASYQRIPYLEVGLFGSDPKRCGFDTRGVKIFN